MEIDGRVVTPATAAASAQPLADILDLGFVESSRGGRIQIKLNRPARFEVDRPDDRSAVLTLTGVRLPKRLERSLDTSALDSPIKMISTFPVPGDGQRVRVVVAADGALGERAERAGDGIVWHLEAKGLKTEEVAVSNRAAAFTTEPAVIAAQTVSGRTKYAGKKVSFEFKDIDIHNLLRVIAEVSKKNIVVADDVSGKITIRLRNVPWDEALDIILASKGLGKEEIGDILRVAPLKALEEEARLREERKKALRRQEELLVQLIPVNYAAAAEMAPRVKDVLSERGTVAVDPRTNTLIVRDIGSNIGKARGLVEKLDTITPQVLIESRIVEANTNFSRSIGVQWGGFGQGAPASGNPTGLQFPSTVRVTGGVGHRRRLGHRHLRPAELCGEPPRRGGRRRRWRAGIHLRLGQRSGAAEPPPVGRGEQRYGEDHQRAQGDHAAEPEGQHQPGRVHPLQPGVRPGREHHLRRGPAAAGRDAAHHL